MTREPIPEPWMFGVDVAVDGVPLGAGQVMRFTLLGRLRMLLRTLRGKPALNGVRLDDPSDDFYPPYDGDGEPI